MPPGPASSRPAPSHSPGASGPCASRTAGALAAAVPQLWQGTLAAARSLGCQLAAALCPGGHQRVMQAAAGPPPGNEAPSLQPKPRSQRFPAANPQSSPSGCLKGRLPLLLVLAFCGLWLTQWYQQGQPPAAACSHGVTCPLRACPSAGAEVQLWLLLSLVAATEILSLRRVPEILQRHSA